MKTRLLVTVSLHIYLALNYSDSSVMLLEPVWVSFLVTFTFKLKRIYFSSQIKLHFHHGDQVKATRTDNSLSHYQCNLEKTSLARKHIEGAIYLGLWFQKSNSPSSSQGHGRHGCRHRSWSSKLKAHILRTSMKHRERTGNGASFKTSKSTSSDILSLSRPHLSNLPTECY